MTVSRWWNIVNGEQRKRLNYLRSPRKRERVTLTREEFKEAVSDEAAFSEWAFAAFQLFNQHPNLEELTVEKFGGGGLLFVMRVTELGEYQISKTGHIKDYVDAGIYLEY